MSPTWSPTSTRLGRGSPGRAEDPVISLQMLFSSSAIISPCVISTATTLAAAPAPRDAPGEAVWRISYPPPQTQGHRGPANPEAPCPGEWPAQPKPQHTAFQGPPSSHLEPEHSQPGRYPAQLPVTPRREKDGMGILSCRQSAGSEAHPKGRSVINSPRESQAQGDDLSFTIPTDLLKI